MIRNSFNVQAVKDSTVYESPKCDMYDVESEGVLCASFETPIEDDPLAW